MHKLYEYLILFRAIYRSRFDKKIGEQILLKNFKKSNDY